MKSGRFLAPSSLFLCCCCCIRWSRVTNLTTTSAYDDNWKVLQLPVAVVVAVSVTPPLVFSTDSDRSGHVLIRLNSNRNQENKKYFFIVIA